jgi:hypothetical protein
MLHNRITGFGEKIYYILSKIKQSRTPVFKPVKIPVKPHLYWFLSHKDKLIVELSIGISTTLAAVIIIIMKIWK